MPYIPSPLDPGPSGAPVAPPTPPGVLRVNLDAMLRIGGKTTLTHEQQAILDASLMTRSPELDQYFSDSRVYRMVGRAAPLPIDLVEPDEPAPVGDRWPCHVFWAPMPEPLGPVLRKDRAPAGSLLDALGPWLEADLPAEPLEAGPACDPWIRMPDGQWRRFTPDEVAAAMQRDVIVSARAVRRARLRRFWDAYHEWIAVAVILAVAAAAAWGRP